MLDVYFITCQYFCFTNLVKSQIITVDNVENANTIYRKFLVVNSQKMTKIKFEYKIEKMGVKML